MMPGNVSQWREGAGSSQAKRAPGISISHVTWPQSKSSRLERTLLVATVSESSGVVKYNFMWLPLATSCQLRY